jgi:hypothetical protein
LVKTPAETARDGEFTALTEQIVKVDEAIHEAPAGLAADLEQLANGTRGRSAFGETDKCP